MTPVPIQPTRVFDGLMGSTLVVAEAAAAAMVRWSSEREERGRL